MGGTNAYHMFKASLSYIGEILFEKVKKDEAQRSLGSILNATTTTNKTKQKNSHTQWRRI